MNFRITTFFFGLLLTMLWIFGLMIAHKKTGMDKTTLVPSLQAPDVKIDKIVLQREDKGKELPPLECVQIAERWYLLDKKSEQKVRIDGFRMEDVIKAVKNAKHDETADVSKPLQDYGLDKPQLTVTLFGKTKEGPKEWKFFVGKESADNSFYYVNSSERQDKAYAVGKRPLESLFMKEPDSLRSKRLFDFIESGVTAVDVKTKDSELALKRDENKLWMFVKPALGFAGFVSSAAEDKDKKQDEKIQPKGKDKDGSINSVKGLLETIVQVRVDDDEDFVPLGKPPAEYGLANEAPMRIDITTVDDKKQTSKDTLLIGNKTKNKRGEFYYVRLASDDGVMLINTSYFAPIEKTVADPGKIRSKDLAIFDKQNVDYIVLKQGKEEIKFFKPEHEDWQMFVGTEKKTADGKGVEMVFEKKQKPNEKALDTLLEQMQGKNAIVQFEYDHFNKLPPEALKKEEAAVGLDSSAAQILIYTHAIEEKKKDEKSKKDDKEKKEEKAKDEKNKKDEKEKKADPLPTLKKAEDLKAAVILALGNVDKEKDLVHARRTLEAGATVSRFTLTKEFVDKVLPSEGIVLAYLDTDLPAIAMRDIASVEWLRTTEKGVEKVTLRPHVSEGKTDWYVKDQMGNTNLINHIVGELTHLHAKKWLKKIDPKDEAIEKKYGLKNPSVTVSITVKKFPPEKDKALPLAAALFSVGGGGFDSPLPVAFLALGSREADKGEVVIIKFGNPTEDEKDKPGTYAEQSGVDLPFLAAANLVKEIKDADVYDRSYVFYAQAQMEAFYMGSAMLDPMGRWMLASPFFTGTIHQIDPKRVQEIILKVRSRYEVRTFDFERKDKDDTWTDKLKLPGFQPDDEKVTKLVQELCKLQTKRFVAFAGGPRDEYKLSPNDATAIIDLILKDGSKITLTIGGEFQHRDYFANSSLWPPTVFFLPSSTVNPLLKEGAANFGKERVAGN